MSDTAKYYAGMAILVGLLLFGLNKCENMENSSDETHKDQKGNWKRICLEGHVVLTRKTGYKGYAVNKLTDEGKPVKCER